MTDLGILRIRIQGLGAGVVRGVSGRGSSIDVSASSGPGVTGVEALD